VLSVEDTRSIAGTTVNLFTLYSVFLADIYISFMCNLKAFSHASRKGKPFVFIKRRRTDFLRVGNGLS
jgi:hypothetical protein